MALSNRFCRHYLMDRRGGDDRVTVGSLDGRDAQHGRRPRVAVPVALARRDGRHRRGGVVRRRRGRRCRPRRWNPLRAIRDSVCLLLS